MMRLFVILLMGTWLCVSQAIAHTFFVGSSEILVNEHTKSVEVIHRFTSHDLETLLSDRNQKRIYADSEEYLQMVKAYVEKGFALTDAKGNKLPLKLVGIEAGINETFIYQEIDNVGDIKGVKIFHRLLTDYFPNQKNRVNYESPTATGSLLFDNNIRTRLIK